MKDFSYYKPSTVPEAVALLAASGENRPLAGGMTLLPTMKMRLASPTAIVDLAALPGLTTITVGGGSYVLPADHVAALGQGNSNAGASIVSKMFKSGPYGSAPTPLHGTGVKMPHLNLTPKAPKIARGGQAGHGKPTPIIAAGGEIVLSPEQIIKRFGSLEKGHKALDHWVNKTRKKHIKTLRGLRPPKKD